MSNKTHYDPAPAGALRVGINFGNVLLASRGDHGSPRGIAVDLAQELTRRAGVAMDIVSYDSAGRMADGAQAGAWDVAFLAVDPVRAQEIVFTEPYLEVDTTYLVWANSALRTLEDVDRDGVRISISNKSAYDLLLTRSLKHAQLVRAPDPESSVALFFDAGGQISSFGEDEAGEIYVVFLNGFIFRLTNTNTTTTPRITANWAASSAFAASTAGGGGALTAGYVRTQGADGQPSPSGLAIFSLRQGGVLVSEASVPASRAIVSGRVFAEIGPNVNTGVVLANLNPQEAAVSFYFTDAGGAKTRTSEFDIPAGSQLAAF